MSPHKSPSTPTWAFISPLIIYTFTVVLLALTLQHTVYTVFYEFYLPKLTKERNISILQF